MKHVLRYEPDGWFLYEDGLLFKYFSTFCEGEEYCVMNNILFSIDDSLLDD